MTLFTDPLAALEELKRASSVSSRAQVIVRTDDGYGVMPKASAIRRDVMPLGHMRRRDVATQWTTSDIRRLIGLRATGSGLDECSTLMGRHRNSCSYAFNKYANAEQKAMARKHDYERRSVSLMRAWA